MKSDKVYGGVKIVNRVQYRMFVRANSLAEASRLLDIPIKRITESRNDVEVKLTSGQPLRVFEKVLGGIINVTA